LRASARIDGQRGFLFVNNYIRERELPSRPGTQFEIRVTGQTLLVPAMPIYHSGQQLLLLAVNLDLDGVMLRYATAQPILKIKFGGETYAFFKSISGIAAEFAFPAANRSAGPLERGMFPRQTAH